MIHGSRGLAILAIFAICAGLPLARAEESGAHVHGELVHFRLLVKEGAETHSRPAYQFVVRRTRSNMCSSRTPRTLAGCD